MKKIIFTLVAAVMMLSCNAQSPKASDEAKKFAENAQMTDKEAARFYAVTNKIDEMSAPLAALADKYRASADEAEKAAVMAEYEKVESEIKDLVMKTIKENRDNAIPAFFAQSIMYDLDYDQLVEFCAEGTGYYDNPAMDRPKRLLEGLKKRAPGQYFQDLEENDLEGNPHKLSEYVGRGNYVLVDFWASWCGPCRQEMPVVKAAYEKYHAKGFEIVGLSFDQKHDAWQKAVKDMELSWIHLSDLKGWQTLAGQVYGVFSIPACILVDPEGKIVAEGLRGEALGAKLAEIYGF